MLPRRFFHESTIFVAQEDEPTLLDPVNPDVQAVGDFTPLEVDPASNEARRNGRSDLESKTKVDFFERIHGASNCFNWNALSRSGNVEVCSIK